LLLSTILEDVWGNGGIAQLSRNDETGWKWLVTFTPHPSHLRGKIL
jgi:hypothetical protein